jgi:hypothetical protein
LKNDSFLRWCEVAVLKENVASTNDGVCLCACVCLCVCVCVYTYAYLNISYCIVQRMYRILSHSACALASSMYVQPESERERGIERDTHIRIHIHTHTLTQEYVHLQSRAYPRTSVTHPLSLTLYLDMISRRRGHTCKCPCIRLCFELFQLRRVLPPTLPLALTKSCPVHECSTICSLSLSFSPPFSHFHSRSLTLSVSLLFRSLALALLLSRSRSLRLHNQDGID